MARHRKSRQRQQSRQELGKLTLFQKMQIVYWVVSGMRELLKTAVGQKILSWLVAIIGMFLG